MRILHLSTWDLLGGAARGAYWLHRSLVDKGVDSVMLVSQKSSDDRTVVGPETGNRKLAHLLQRKMDNALLHRYPQREPTVFSPAWAPSFVHREVSRINPDIIHLHWVCSGFVNPRNLVHFKRPVLWTLRDMWTFTGGCHYSGSCTKYTESCGACPQLGSEKETDITRKTWNRKDRSWRSLDFPVVAISNWLADCAKASSLFKDRETIVIHNGVDESVFHPREKAPAKLALGLPPDRKVILFGAPNASTDRRKGFRYVLEAADRLVRQGWAQKAVLVVFGSPEPPGRIWPGMETLHLGHIDDDAHLSRVYSAGDVMLVPSVQEAFGKTAVEALACGTPVVSFDMGGLKDIVDHRTDGYRAECFSSEDLARGVDWVIGEDERWKLLSRQARSKVLKKFTLDRCARNYLDMYAKLLK